VNNSVETTNILGAQLSRRGFIKAGGALYVGFTLLDSKDAQGAVAKNSIDPSQFQSWVEIHADNTVILHTGKCDFGQSSLYTAYRQIIADELEIPFESITAVIGGDTDRTPDGGGTFDLLGRGVTPLRKAAAYTREAMVELAAQRLGIAKDQLTIKAGVISGGGKSVTYGELVKDQNLKLSIPVTGDLTTMFGLTVEGNPPLKPVSKYEIIGKPYRNSIIPAKVTAKETWVTDVKVPGMWHARMVHPATLGSKLIAAGSVDKSKFPNAQIVVKGNLLGVVAPTEWEAIQASRQVAASTKWSEWKGLPSQPNLFRYFRQDADWKSTTVSRSQKSGGDAASAMASAKKKHAATYEMPFMKHAPIGPTMALADYKADGTVTVHTHNQNPQAPATTAVRTAAMPEPKTKPCYFRRNSAGLCACSGCAARIFSGPRNRPPVIRTCRLASMRATRSRRTPWIITCRPCRTIGLWARSSRGFRPCPRLLRAGSVWPTR
jgi:CO/xanthine dehydrogenase Mo-binding subunit